MIERILCTTVAELPDGPIDALRIYQWIVAADADDGACVVADENVDEALQYVVGRPTLDFHSEPLALFDETIVNPLERRRNDDTIDELTASNTSHYPLNDRQVADRRKHLLREAIRTKSGLDDGDGATHASARSDHCSTSSAESARFVDRPITASQCSGLMPVPGRLYVMSDSTIRWPAGKS